jgi:hypothetical protein
LALLSALVVSAIAAPSAFAVTAKNTTAFTCVKVAKAKTGDFEDAHCDVTSKEKTGEFTHELILPNVTTNVVLTNEKTKNATTESTPAILKTTIFGVQTEITCKKANGEGTFTNEETEPKVHTGKGSGSTKMTECTVAKPSKCTVKEPIEIKLVGVPVEKLGAKENEMGGELKPAVGETIVEVVLQGAECAVKATYKVNGTVIATGTPSPTEKHSGSTAIYTNAMTKETLKFGGNPAEFSLATTVRMAPLEGKEQNPVSATTTT